MVERDEDGLLGFQIALHVVRSAGKIIRYRLQPLARLGAMEKAGWQVI